MLKHTCRAEERGQSFLQSEPHNGDCSQISAFNPAVLLDCYYSHCTIF